VTRDTAASSAGPGQAGRNGHAPACAGEAGAAAAVDFARDRPRPGQTSRRVIDRAAGPMRLRPVAGRPVRRDLRVWEPAGAGPWLPLCQAPEGGAAVTGPTRMTRWTRTRPGVGAGLGGGRCE